MIARSLFRAAFRTPRFFYSTAPPAGNAPSFKFPRRWEMKVAAFDQVYDVMRGLTQYRQFAHFLRDNLSYFTDQHMGDLYIIFSQLDLELDNNFYDFILPITKQYIKKYTFQDAESFTKIIIGSLTLDIQDDQYWELVLHKLYDQKCYKYVSLPQVLTITQGFLQNPRLNSHPVVQQFAKILHQQQEFFSLYSQEKSLRAEALSSKIIASFKSKEPQQKLLDNEAKKLNAS